MTLHAPLAILACILFMSSPYAKAKTLADLKSRFEQESAKLHEQHATSEKKAFETYDRNLALAVDRYKKQGDLDRTVVASRELERFKTENTVSDETADNWPALLINIHTTYHAATANADQVKNRNSQKLIALYLNALEKLKTDLVRQGNMDGALLTNEEILRMEFILADIESQMPIEEPDHRIAGPRSSSTTKSLPATLSKGLVLHYSFEERRSNGEVSDKSGKGNHGQVIGVETTDRKHGNRACEFKGNDAHIAVPPAEDLKMEDAVTLSSWIKPTSLLAAYQNIVSDHSPSANNGKILSMNRDRIEFLLGAEGSAEVGYPLPDQDKWYHVAASYDGQKMVLCVNGREVDSVTRPGKIARNDNALLVAKSGYGEPFTGALDEIMIWARGLSPSEIEKLYDLQE
jgi:hypothetical protein